MTTIKLNAKTRWTGRTVLLLYGRYDILLILSGFKKKIITHSHDI